MENKKPQISNEQAQQQTKQRIQTQSQMDYQD